MPPTQDVAVAQLLDPSGQGVAGGGDAESRSHLAPAATLEPGGHFGDLASLANGTCNALSTLKSACAHSHQMAIAPCGKGAFSLIS